MTIRVDLLKVVTENPGYGVKYYASMISLTSKQVSRTIWELQKDGLITHEGTAGNRSYYGLEPSKQYPRQHTQYPRQHTYKRTLLHHLLGSPSQYLFIPTAAQQLGWPKEKTGKAMIGLKNSGMLVKHPDDAGKTRGCRYRPSDAALLLSRDFMITNDGKPPLIQERPTPPVKPEAVASPLGLTGRSLSTQRGNEVPLLQSQRSVEPPPTDPAILRLMAHRDKLIAEAEEYLSQATALGDAIEVLLGIIGE